MTATVLIPVVPNNSVRSIVLRGQKTCLAFVNAFHIVLVGGYNCGHVTNFIHNFDSSVRSHISSYRVGASLCMLRFCQVWVLR